MHASCFCLVPDAALVLYTREHILDTKNGVPDGVWRYAKSDTDEAGVTEAMEVMEVQGNEPDSHSPLLEILLSDGPPSYRRFLRLWQC